MCLHVIRREVVDAAYWFQNKTGPELDATKLQLEFISGAFTVQYALKLVRCFFSKPKSIVLGGLYHGRGSYMTGTLHVQQLTVGITQYAGPPAFIKGVYRHDQTRLAA